MPELHLHTSELKQAIPELRAGDRLLLSGTVYTARDAAHKRIFALLDQGKELPFPLEEAVIYYAGPTPAQKGMAVGSCGPTTSSRMDPYAPRLLDLGLIRGTRVTCTAKSPAGDPAAYLIRGAVIALRRADAEGIRLERRGGAPSA